MTTINIQLHLDTDAFVDRTQIEVAWILNQLATGPQFSQLADAEDVVLTDTHGEPCGKAWVN